MTRFASKDRREEESDEVTISVVCLERVAMLFFFSALFFAAFQEPQEPIGR